MQSVILNMLYWNFFINFTETTTNSPEGVSNKTSELFQQNPGSNVNESTRELLVNTSPLPLLPQNSRVIDIIPSLPEKENEVCYPLYGEEVCFSVGGPWSTNRSRPIVEIPSHPDIIDTTFHLYSRYDVATKLLELEDIDVRRNFTYERNKKYKLIAHGYRSSIRATWVQSMVDELLRAEDDVVIFVDWHKGSRDSYAQAAANTRVVGVQVAHLIHRLAAHHGIPLASFHLIGHSLGSHLLGHCGHHLKHTYNMVIPRITALDPAGPFYKHTQPSARLDPSDADFVDVIHTDNDSIFGFPLSFGMIAPIGHLDYYPNGGTGQPKCSYGNINCQHQRAIELFTESIRQSCTFIGIVCESYEKFRKGDCWGCEYGKTCSPMGMKAVPLPEQPTMTKLFLATYGHSPFCGSQLRITVQIRNESSSAGHDGEFAVIGIELNGARETTGEILLSEKSVFYTAGATHKIVVLTNNVGILRSITVSFHYPGSIFNPMSWRIRSPILHVHSILVEELYPPKRWKFCFKEPYLTPYLKYKLSTEHWC